MKKPLLLFIIFSLLLLIAGIAYQKYCKAKPDGCKERKVDVNDLGPQEGIDW
ncbi:hypothetical protein MNB_SV-4-717 [hydrothermal vent metagenome]|uniref:Uncharacterized protein n=1 Tax=hydrothermal vent metagenome TaxID=652676 RepID=A0A1W1E7P1_9ZZZZ